MHSSREKPCLRVPPWRLMSRGSLAATCKRFVSRKQSNERLESAANPVTLALNTFRRQRLRSFDLRNRLASIAAARDWSYHRIAWNVAGNVYGRHVPG